MSGKSQDAVVPSGFFAVQNPPAGALMRSQPAGMQMQQPHYPQYSNTQPRPSTYAYYPYAAGFGHQQHSGTPMYPYATAAVTTAPPPFASRKRPREQIFRCEPCNLDLDSAQALESHKKSHVKCSACDFQGAPKVVKGHFQSVHGIFSGSGFKTVTVAIPGCPVQRFRICVGNQPEDVQKWIEERKKRFPRSRPIPRKTETVVTEGKKTSGLASLLEGYSSSEEDEATEAPAKQACIETQSQTSAKPALGESTESHGNHTNSPISRQNNKPCHSFVRHGSCRRGNNCPYSHDESLRKPSHGRKQRNKKDLLSNLLRTDADRETKLSLQLIHYLVHSNFLQERI